MKIKNRKRKISFFYLGLLLFTLLPLLGSCSDNKEPVKAVDLRYKAEDKYIVSSENPATITIQVKSTDLWEVYSKNNEWSTITPDNGEAGEIFDVAITYNDNKNLDDRVDTVTVKSDYWIGKEITVLQRGNAFLNLENEKDFLLPKENGNYTFQVKSNQDWSAKVTEGENWLSISDGETGSIDGDITVSCIENKGAKRYGKVIVYDRHEVARAEVTCTQDGIQVDPINADGSILTCQRTYYDQSEVTIDVVANSDWFVEKDNADQEWYSFEKVQYNGNDKIVIHLDENEGMSLRKATFTVSSKLIEGLDPVSHVITIKQGNNPLLLTKRIEFDDAEQNNWTPDNGTVVFEGGDMICKPGRVTRSGFVPGYYKFHIKSMSADGYSLLFFTYPGLEFRFHLNAKTKKTAMSTTPWTILNSQQISFDPTVENSIGLNVLDNGDGLTRIEWSLNGNEVREMITYGNFEVDFSRVSSSFVYLGASTGTVIYDWYEFTPLVDWGE